MAKSYADDTLPLKERVYRHIRDRLIAGTMPPGQRVSEAELAKEIGVSRTPVREAIVRLETIGLVEALPGYGTRICKPDRRDIEESFELRQILECGAVKLAAERMDDAGIAELEKIFEQQRALSREMRKTHAPETLEAIHNKANVLDMAFHLAIMVAARNNRLLQMVSEIQLLTRVLRYRANLPEMPPVKRAAHILRDHRRIIKALKDRDPQAVEVAMRQHIGWAHQMHLAAYDWHEREASASAAMKNDLFFTQNVLDLLNRMEDAVLPRVGEKAGS